MLDRNEITRYQSLAGRLRRAGIATELFLGSAGMNAQLKYADRRGSICAVIQGSNERDAERGCGAEYERVDAGGTAGCDEQHHGAGGLGQRGAGGGDRDDRCRVGAGRFVSSRGCRKRSGH